ncbi:MAG: hypothetical protein B7Y12_13605 [Rhizobiales bacterium 24-66-13]|jgi:hypothetical protein|uniref:hypothetical protein n=1 Tax=Roseixanthobacter finlandensis TaxID=3119922 RepID=UPI000BC73A7E|nr:MAG: hypothetical protein B7Y12_13605 [Rhizobiales bacterium 24-66-13]OZA98679.1 MAG: hypothetical protein B7X67_21835 [Rhizobiales bacterium 39-66-18]HQS08704.1 hypothetical protein [Xanthobacteraceae bacterium]HQS49912.1 hypothetical protein [Xanthobacteraceae bacterium]
MEDQTERREEAAFRVADQRGAEGEVVKPAPKARQGLTSGRIVTILAVGLVLVIIGFAASYMTSV